MCSASFSRISLGLLRIRVTNFELVLLVLSDVSVVDEVVALGDKEEEAVAFALLAGSFSCRKKHLSP